MKVYFNNIKSLCLKRKIKKIFDCALKECPIEYKAFSVYLTLVNKEKIQELNNKFRNINKSTDVLSFPNLELNKGENFNYKEMIKEINPGDGLINLGDIIICDSIAKEQAKILGHSYKREICFLSIHGFLHLLGYDHINNDDEIEMNMLTDNILNKYNIRRN